MLGYQPPEGYVTLARAEELLDVSSHTLNRLLIQRQITVHHDPD